MKDNKSNIIICPNCGAEYLPAEIFLPDSFLGKPETINKNSRGEIIYYSGESMSLEEKYVCDYCNKTFKVNGKIQFNAIINKDVDFDEDYSTPLKKKGLFLTED